VVSSRPPNLQKTKEKLKNPQQPNTQAPESQEGLKRNGAGEAARPAAGGIEGRPWVKSTHHSSALRKGEDKKKAKKNAILRLAVL
jgi:hypothetical protein